MPKCYDNETYCSIDRREYYEYVKKVENLHPNNAKMRYEYSKEIMPGQLFLYYIVDELQKASMGSAYAYSNYNSISKVTFSTGAIETLLRAIYFMLDHLHDGLPEHNYKYMISNSSTFFNELQNAIEENLNVKE